MSKINLIGMTTSDLERLMVSMGQEQYRGRQLFRWLYKNHEHDFELLTDLSKDLRQRLSSECECVVLRPEETLVSGDGTSKYLYRTNDGAVFESVLIPDDESGRRTVCVSSQIGCALGCRFCATGALGFGRDLSVMEIVSQLLYLRRVLGEAAFTNIVFMGMGEPLLNFDNVMAAVSIITDGAGLSHAAKKITISTAGIIPGIKRLVGSGTKVRLAVSLNAATQEKRERIMPVTRKYSLVDLKSALIDYTRATGTRVTLEYALFEGFNDSNEDISALIKFVHGLPCKINLLAYNPVEGLPFKRPHPQSVDAFAKKLYPHVPAVTVRKSRGADIGAACGQLAGERKQRRE
ncbi:MAG: 23S rRNA (adenine(2503)-C(2))-methyltransferase RlmN [bacterium]